MKKLHFILEENEIYFDVYNLEIIKVRLLDENLIPRGKFYSTTTDDIIRIFEENGWKEIK